MKHLFTIFILLPIFVFAQTKDVVNTTSSKGDKSVQFHSSQVINGPAGSIFGMYTKNIGDINGDGFEDFAISSRNEDNFNGAVRIYFGGENADLEPDLIIRGTNQESLGENFANAGDFNGDGFDDLMISNGSNPPEVKLYYGGPNFDLIADVSFTDDYVAAGFGTPMTKLGDINGDGFDDVAIGNSSVNIYLGRSEQSFNITPDYKIDGYGSLTTYCGDINGDGFDDVVVASGGTEVVNFFAGSENFDIEPDAFIQGGSSYGFGNSIFGGKDINNDGLVDFVIGEPARTVNGLSNVGAIYVLLGKTNLFENTNSFGLSSDFYMFGTKEGERFGHSVSIVQDMNGDGFDEIAVGENFNLFSGEQNKVLIYNGGNQIKSAPSNVFNSREAGNLGYFAVASIDLNQDGYGEVLAADFSNDIVYYFDNSKSNAALFNEFDIVLTLQCSYSLDISGDFNGDGYNDLLTYPEGLFLNQSGSFNSEPDDTVLGKFAGDVNGDGFDEIISRPENNVINILWGNNDEDFSSELLYQVPDSLTLKFVTYGDFNGDGLSDVVLKSYKHNYSTATNEQQRFLIFYGGEYLSSEPDVVKGNDNKEMVNCQVGDFNGDSFDDILLEYIYDKTRKLEIVYGTSKGLNADKSSVYDFAYIDPDKYNKSCDFNGDGFDDLTVYNPDEKKQYIIFGSNDNDYWFNPNFIEFNPSFSNADVNNDGIADAVTQGKIYYGGENFPNSGYINIPSHVKMLSAGDINNDGLDDLLMLDYYEAGEHRFGIVLNSQQNLAPRIVSVKDVPADQGGKVTLSWFKSSLDGGKVKNYQIERSIAPMGSGFAWEVINTIPASHFNYYSYTAPTLNDQTPENIGNTYFRITALTENNDIYYRSNIMYGHSTDNLAPLAPSGLKAVSTNEGVKLSWKLNNESDFKEYKIYRSLEKEVDLDTLEVYGTSTDSIFMDETPTGEPTHYFVRGTDIHGNIGVSSSTYLNITGVNESKVLPTEYALLQNFPNPFNQSTTITFAIPKAGRVSLRVYNMLGEEVAELINRDMKAGSQRVNFNASKLSPGLYFYRIKAGNFVDFKKMLLLK